MVTRAARRVGSKATQTLGNDPFVAMWGDPTPNAGEPVSSERSERVDGGSASAKESRHAKSNGDARATRHRKKPAKRTAATRVEPSAESRAKRAPSVDHGDVRSASGAGIDPFGFDLAYARRFDSVIDFLFDHYFRCDVKGDKRIPLSGGALLVGNHAGTLPYDGAMVMAAVRHATDGKRVARPLGDDFVFRKPPIANWLSRIGVVRASPDNAHRLLTSGELALVFPEGTRGLGKFFAERYRLERFGRGGFVKVALRAGVPIIPVAIVGSEETHPLLAHVPWLAKLLGLPYFPVTPTFPWFGPFGLVPLPTKFFVRFGEPIVLDASAESIERDADRLAALTEVIRSRVQAMIDEVLATRRSVFFG